MIRVIVNPDRHCLDLILTTKGHSDRAQGKTKKQESKALTQSLLVKSFWKHEPTNGRRENQRYTFRIITLLTSFLFNSKDLKSHCKTQRVFIPIFRDPLAQNHWASIRTSQHRPCTGRCSLASDSSWSGAGYCLSLWRKTLNYPERCGKTTEKR